MNREKHTSIDEILHPGYVAEKQLAGLDAQISSLDAQILVIDSVLDRLGRIGGKPKDLPASAQPSTPAPEYVNAFEAWMASGELGAQLVKTGMSLNPGISLLIREAAHVAFNAGELAAMERRSVAADALRAVSP